MAETVEGQEARAHIDVLSQKYTGDDYQAPIGPKGRIILKIAPRRVVKPSR